MKPMAVFVACVCASALPAMAEDKTSFRIVDVNADSLVSQFEFIRFLTSNTGMPSTDALVQFIEIDTNRSRTISQTEWGIAYAKNPWIRQIEAKGETRPAPKPIQTDTRWLARITD